MNDKFGRLVDGLAPYFREITFVAGFVAPGDPTFYPSARSFYRYSLRAGNVRVVATPSPALTSSPWAKAWAALRRMGPYWHAIKGAEFVYITLPGFSGLLATSLCGILGRPYALYFGADIQEVAPFTARWPRWASFMLRLYLTLGSLAEHAAVRYARFTVVHGRSLLERFRTFSSRVVETVPMIGITTKDVSHREDTCGGEQVTCLYVGAIVPRKGVDYLLDALQVLVKQGYAVRVDLVGAGQDEYSKVLRGRVREQGLQGLVRFLGHITDVATLLDFYRTSDIFVLPTLGEGFPRVLYEAASQGLPIVTTSIRSVGSVLEDGKDALLVPPRDPSALAAGIRRIIDDASLRQRLVRGGYAFAASHLSDRGTAEQVASLIAEACGEERTDE